MVTSVLSFKPRRLPSCLSGLVAERARADGHISRLQLLIDDLQAGALLENLALAAKSRSTSARRDAACFWLFCGPQRTKCSVDSAYTEQERHSPLPKTYAPDTKTTMSAFRKSIPAKLSVTVSTQQGQVDLEALSHETGVPFDVLRTFAGISAPANEHMFTTDSARTAFAGVKVRHAHA